MLNKPGPSVKEKNAYEIHEALVSCSDSDNPLSRKIDNLLNRKFKDEIERSSGFDVHAFMRHWRNCFEVGDWGAVLWAAVTKPDLPKKSRLEIFGDVHMAMHDNAGQIGRLKQQLASWQKECRNISQRFKAEVKSRKSLQKENANLKKNQEKLQVELSSLEKEKAAIEKENKKPKRIYLTELERENNRLRADIQKLTEEREVFEKQMVKVRRENEHLSAELDKQGKSNAIFKRESREIMKQISELNRCNCNANCPSFDLCKKRVLIVGGITRMESAYRQLIESKGGIFEYHDGYMKQGAKKLQDCFRRADLVICPVSCNSHGACSMVKKLGKKHNKAVHILANSSLSAVSNVIRGDGGSAICA